MSWGARSGADFPNLRQWDPEMSSQSSLFVVEGDKRWWGLTA